MIRQLVLPKDGGGSLRRFLGIRKRLFRDQWQDSRPMRGPVPLFDFRRRDDIADLRDSLNPDRRRGIFAGWRVSDDSVIGGYSSSRMEVNEGVKSVEEEKNPLEENSSLEEKNPSSSSSSSSPSPPFLRWSGTLSTEINHRSHLARNVTRSGFAAMFGPEFPFGAPLGSKYKALEICCRTDGRTYAVNLHVDTYFPEDMYQGFIAGDGQQQETINSLEKSAEDENNDSAASTAIRTDGEDEEQSLESEQPQPSQSLDTRQYMQDHRKIAQQIDPDNHPYHGHPPAGFQRLILPFTDFALTSRGRLRNTQRDLDGAISIESIGFTLMDGQDGDFCFDLVSLRAVNVMDGEVVGTEEDDAKLEKLHNSLRSGGKKKEDSDSEDEKSDDVRVDRLLDSRSGGKAESEAKKSEL
mmetsp:Transcript_36523/g.65753  ORF Transcript_36523/g.65753 Transcript_36523/m.65753 type:complete len:410 (-) Transcript_36523:2-1231(-)